MGNVEAEDTLSGQIATLLFSSDAAFPNCGLQEQEPTQGSAMTSSVYVQPTYFPAMTSPPPACVPSPGGAHLDMSPGPMSNGIHFFTDDNVVCEKKEESLPSDMDLDEIFSMPAMQNLQELLHGDKFPEQCTDDAGSGTTRARVATVKQEIPFSCETPLQNCDVLSSSMLTDCTQAWPEVTRESDSVTTQSVPELQVKTEPGRRRNSRLSEVEIQGEIQRRNLKRKQEENLTEDELFRKEKRKHQNRVAAERCRQKKKIQTEETRKRESELLQQNKTQLEEIERLRRQVAQLQNIISNHACVKGALDCDTPNYGLQPIKR